MSPVIRRAYHQKVTHSIWRDELTTATEAQEMSMIVYVYYYKYTFRFLVKVIEIVSDVGQLR